MNRRRGPRWLIAIAVISLASCSTATASSVPTPSQPAVASPSATSIQSSTMIPTAAPSDVPATPIKATTFAVPATFGMSVSGNALWMINNSQIVSFDMASHAIKTIDVGAGTDELDGLTVTKTTIWVADFDASVVIRLDRAPGSKPIRIPVGAAEDILPVGSTIWVTNHHEGSVSRIDPKTNTVIDTVLIGPAGNNGPHEIALGAGSVWIDESNDSSIVRLDPTSGAVVAKITLTHLAACGGILATDTAVWTDACHEGPTLGRIDPTTNTEVAGIRLDSFAQDVLQVNGVIWVPVGENLPAGELERIDSATNSVSARLSINGLNDVASSVVADGAIWIDDGIGTLFEIPVSELPR